MLKLVSEKVKVLTPDEVDASRYEFLDLRSAEPSLGVANVDGAVLVYDSNVLGGRTWSAANLILTTIQANGAYSQANAAYNVANTKVSKSGDTMTGTLTINQSGVGLNVNNNVYVGNTVTAAHRINSNTVILGHFETTHSKLETSSNTIVTLDSFPAAYYGTVKYMIQAKTAEAMHSTELFCMQDGNSTHITEYATLLSGSILGYFSFDIEDLVAKLNFIPENPLNNFITIKVVRQGITS
jgi:opacity protein-like surface antigen